MLLAEAIKEKDYIKESIRNLQNHIVVMDADSDTGIADKYMKELDELYKRYQKFSISIERSKVSTSIKLNKTQVSLVDAFVIKESMEYKLKVYEGILHGILRKEGDEQGQINPDRLFEEMEKIRLDIKTIEGEIDYALWQIEAS